MPPDTNPDGSWVTVPGRPRRGDARMLAECAAKRAVIKAASFYVDYYPDWAPVCEVAGNEGQPCNVTDAFFKHQAAVYADHPDYREEWRP